MATGRRAVVLPMFPLGTVLFPHALLPLHVFEPRYRALVEALPRRASPSSASCSSNAARRSVAATPASTSAPSRASSRRASPTTVATRSCTVGTRRAAGRPAGSTTTRTRAPRSRSSTSRAAPATSARELRGDVASRLLVACSRSRPSSATRSRRHVELDDDPVRASFEACAPAPIGPLDAQRSSRSTTRASASSGSGDARRAAHGAAGHLGPELRRRLGSHVERTGPARRRRSRVSGWILTRHARRARSGEGARRGADPGAAAPRSTARTTATTPSSARLRPAPGRHRIRHVRAGEGPRHPRRPRGRAGRDRSRDRAHRERHLRDRRGDRRADRPGPARGGPGGPHQRRHRPATATERRRARPPHGAAPVPLPDPTPTEGARHGVRDRQAGAVDGGSRVQGRGRPHQGVRRGDERPDRPRTSTASRAARVRGRADLGHDRRRDGRRSSPPEVLMLVVHGEQDMRLHKPITPGMVLQLQGRGGRHPREAERHDGRRQGRVHATRPATSSPSST